MGIPGCINPWLRISAEARQKFRREWNEIQAARLTASDIDALRCLLFAKIVDNRANGISDRTGDSSDLWDIDRKLAQLRKSAI